jgi:hypothetical protein
MPETNVTKISATRWQKDLVEHLTDNGPGPFFLYTADAVLENLFNNFEYDSSAYMENTAFVVADQKLTTTELKQLAKEISEEKGFNNLDTDDSEEEESEPETAA